VTLVFDDQVFLAANISDNEKMIEQEGVGVDAVNLDTRYDDFRGIASAAWCHRLLSTAPLPVLTSEAYW
jgi:hypothetical protein